MFKLHSNVKKKFFDRFVNGLFFFFFFLTYIYLREHIINIIQVYQYTKFTKVTSDSNICLLGKTSHRVKIL